MRYGENPLEVTRRVKDKIRDLQNGLPEGVKIVPFYDRTRLIEGAVDTVRRVLEHEILIATIAILLILTHVRSVFVIIITLPPCWLTTGTTFKIISSAGSATGWETSTPLRSRSNPTNLNITARCIPMN